MTLAAGGDEVSPFSKTGLAPATMTFLAQVGGQPAASATLTRLFMAPDIVRTSIREQGLVGTLFQPSGPGLYPGVIILGGSVGGLGEETAALLASHGLVSLALAYFATDGLPEELVNIPLEYFATALAWLQTVDTIRKDRLAVLGRSRGGELALLLGTMFPQIRAVVAYGGSGLVFAGWGQAGVADQSAWSYRGVPLPFLKEFAMDDPAREQATIPVERIAGPVLLVSGQEDHIWPAGQLSTLIMERLKTSHHPYPDQHLSYPGAGHRIQFPYLPTTSPQFRHPIGNELMSLGGNAKDRAFAEADSWARVLRFLTGNF
ncbi:MAG TPA: acyl-CoA thioester hydrolase/BAAT C-terminal domain-containing protein [Chloroflexia bacterium]|nr:acyl-CoA thioester hydrolase/BAAT C-terminal domain-containing protein [Chloroflexia bacterium]